MAAASDIATTNRSRTSGGDSHGLESALRSGIANRALRRYEQRQPRTCKGMFAAIKVYYSSVEGKFDARSKPETSSTE